MLGEVYLKIVLHDIDEYRKTLHCTTYSQHVQFKSRVDHFHHNRPSKPNIFVEAMKGDGKGFLQQRSQLPFCRLPEQPTGVTPWFAGLSEGQ